MIHISLFSGIGGFELAAEWMGWRNYVSCDINEFGNRVRKHYWPDCYTHTNVKTLNHEIINRELSARYGSDWRDDDIILTGGFPCQPYSSAGKRLGKDDERHLFPEMLRVIQEIKPTFIVGENVYGLTNWNGGVVFEEVCADLEAIGYEVQPVLLPASGIGAPHHRMRVWFVAYSNGSMLRTNEHGVLRCEDGENKSQRAQGIYNAFRSNGNSRNATNTTNIGQEYALENGKLERRRFRQSYQPDVWDTFPSKSPICSGNDGISNGLDGITFSKWRQQSIMAYGNAVVPQLVYTIFKAIDDTKRTHTSSTRPQDG